MKVVKSFIWFKGIHQTLFRTWDRKHAFPSDRMIMFLINSLIKSNYRRHFNLSFFLSFFFFEILSNGENFMRPHARSKVGSSEPHRAYRRTLSMMKSFLCFATNEIRTHTLLTHAPSWATSRGPLIFFHFFCSHLPPMVHLGGVWQQGRFHGNLDPEI